MKIKILTFVALLFLVIGASSCSEEIISPNADEQAVTSESNTDESGVEDDNEGF